mmetsp:Transcript_115084/g.330645  ORF Transcript_115084/g.330645 Transcript_115084/m.330645 type:complete len:233 (-) Transcript_115084:139-837(-)
MYNLKSLYLSMMVMGSSVNSFAPLLPSHRAMSSVLTVKQVDTNTLFLLSSSCLPAGGPLHVASSMQDMDSTTEVENEAVVEAPKPMPKLPKQAHGKEGILSPLVLAIKSLMDESRFNELRAKVINLHSNVIEGFVVKNSDTPLGQAVLKRMFSIVDQNHNGAIELEELQIAVQRLGFEWLKEKQVQGILSRADTNHNGKLELEEFLAEAPKTLRTNLIKLAKKNGGELGLLV